MCLIYKLILLKPDVVYDFESFVFALWSVLISVSVFRIPSSYKSLLRHIYILIHVTGAAAPTY